MSCTSVHVNRWRLLRSVGSKVDNSLTKSDLIESLARNQNHLALKDVELAVKSLLEKMSQELASGERIEIRGFGSFSLHFRPARMGRNPKSGDAVALSGKYVPHFKPGKELRERVDYINTDPSKVGKNRLAMEARLKEQALSRPANPDGLSETSVSRSSNMPDSRNSLNGASARPQRSETASDGAIGGRRQDAFYAETPSTDNSRNNDS